MKRFFSVLLSLTIIINIFTISSFSTTVSAASYADTLRKKGFPESYIEQLVSLHNTYPNWIFEPLNTGLKWQDAINGERSSHSKQLIEKCSLYDTNMYCDCKNCYKNGSYVVREGYNWVAASENAVKYFMDPRNWLDEKHIFQFESTAYDGTQTTAGVEAILDGTWMHDSLISYKTTGGSDKTYDQKTKYCDAIMKSANDSGMSAYYLASKIRQENGGVSPTATAVKGTASPFQGMYNYYNIGANTGAYDGLCWAAGYLKTNKKTTMYSSYNTTTGKAGGTLTTVANGVYLTWRDTVGDYYKVRIYYENGANSYSEGKSGYILKSDVRTYYTRFDTSSTAGWGRPWSNPYLSIYHGAKYIARNFSDQDSGYLQKFNVVPESSSLYSHEYMANVAAAASESVTTYNAYKKANILSITKKFVIPVFKNMPNEAAAPAELSQVDGLTCYSRSSVAVALKWIEMDDASGYEVQAYKSGKWVTEADTSSAKYTVRKLKEGTEYKFRVRAYTKVGDKLYYGEYCEPVTDITYSDKITGIRSSTSYSAITISWDKKTNGTGYKVTKYDEAKKKYVLYKDIVGLENSTVKITGLAKNKTYKFKIYAYTKSDNLVRGGYNDELSLVTNNNKVTIGNVTSPSTKKISVKWTPLPMKCTGYEIMWSTSSNFSSNFLSKIKKGATANNITLTTSRSKTTYYVRVRAYRVSNGKTIYYNWSTTKKIKVK